MRRDGGDRAAEAAAEHGQAAGRPAQPAGERDDVAGPGARAQHRRAPGQVAQRRHRQHHRVAARRRGHGVAPDDGGTQGRALVGEPRGDPLQPAGGRVRRAGQADQQRGGRGAHRRDVGQVRRRRLVADVLGRGPVPAEVPALDEHVGAWRPRGRRACVTTAASSPGPTSASPAGPARATTRSMTPNSPTAAHGVGLPGCGEGRSGPTHEVPPVTAVGCRPVRHPAGTTYRPSGRRKVLPWSTPTSSSRPRSARPPRSPPPSPRSPASRKRRGRHRPLRRHRPRRGRDRRRARPPGRRARAVGRRHHPHADLPRRQHLTAARSRPPRPCEL